MDIKFFCGEFSFLSNFWEAEINVRGFTFPSVEHAYQAFKTDDKVWFNRIRNAKSPGVAKRMGKQCPIRKDWESVKFDIMRECVFAKFSQHEDLKEKLLQTKGKLEEGNTWGDKVWGVVSGVGQNWLGRILMDIRSELQNKG